jgi:hypothetical protein
MTLSEEARERVKDIVALQPTKNAELQAQWGMDSGSEVYQYLRSELDEYYYRNEDSLICATPKAQRLVGDGDIDFEERVVSGTALDARTVETLPGPDGDPQSVVATLQALREQGDDPEVDAVRSTLNRLADAGVVERVRKTVPTFRLALDREKITVEVENTTDES